MAADENMANTSSPIWKGCVIFFELKSCLYVNSIPWLYTHKKLLTFYWQINVVANISWFCHQIWKNPGLAESSLKSDEKRCKKIFVAQTVLEIYGKNRGDVFFLLFTVDSFTYAIWKAMEANFTLITCNSNDIFIYTGALSWFCTALPIRSFRIAATFYNLKSYNFDLIDMIFCSILYSRLFENKHGSKISIKKHESKLYHLSENCFENKHDRFPLH